MPASKPACRDINHRVPACTKYGLFQLRLGHGRRVPEPSKLEGELINLFSIQITLGPTIYSSFVNLAIYVTLRENQSKSERLSVRIVPSEASLLPTRPNFICKRDILINRKQPAKTDVTWICS